jgi:peptidoglycan glycosyltransferase
MCWMPAKLSTSLALGVGVAVALTALAAERGSSPAARVAQVAGAPLDSPEASGDGLRSATSTERSRGSSATKVSRKVSSALTGDADLAGLVDPAKIERVGDRYELPLADGRRAILTLDPDIQTAAETVLARAKSPRGAIVVTATDGRILALAGRRTLDPKGGKDGIVDWREAIDTWAPAASIFKIVTAAALVEAGVEPEARVCYHGGIRSVMESNLVDDRADRRCEDLSFGLAHSQNAIIAKLTHQHLTPPSLADTAKKLGFTGPLPEFALRGDAGACELPTDKGVEFAKAAAGFSGTKLSVVGGALLANTVASGGMLVTPRLIAEVVDGEHRQTVKDPAPRRVLARDVARKVGRMMVETCDSGSAARAFRGAGKLGKGKVAGKTGTLSTWEPNYIQYSWFVGYAPADQPTVSIAVLLGNAELWHLKAHTAARLVLDEAVTTP